MKQKEKDEKAFLRRKQAYLRGVRLRLEGLVKRYAKGSVSEFVDRMEITEDKLNTWIKRDSSEKPRDFQISNVNEIHKKYHISLNYLLLGVGEIEVDAFDRNSASSLKRAWNETFEEYIAPLLDRQSVITNLQGEEEIRDDSPAAERTLRVIEMLVREAWDGKFQEIIAPIPGNPTEEINKIDTIFQSDLRRLEKDTFNRIFAIHKIELATLHRNLHEPPRKEGFFSNDISKLKKSKLQYENQSQAWKKALEAGLVNLQAEADKLMRKHA